MRRQEYVKALGRAALAFTGALLVLAAGASPISARQPAPAGEFLGPFASWIDVQRAHRAAGDGVTDDTAALQAALDEVIGNPQAAVVFLPRGTYRITRTLTLRYGLQVGIVGEDPETTILRWDGEPGGTMLDVVGVAYSRINRLTFDGQRRAGVAVEQELDGKGGNFDTGNEYADDRFVDVGFGIHGGFGAGGFAETSILRAVFLRNTRAGVALGNFNALDAWIWDSRFEDCTVGVTNEPGAGNYRVYGSVFRRSTTADLVMQNTGTFTARDNYSIGSRAFYVSGRAVNHPAPIDIQGNTIVDTIDSTAIRLTNQGPGLIMDNVIRSRPGAAGPAIAWRSILDVDVASVGNTFSARMALNVEGRLLSLEDRQVSREQITPVEPTLPSAPRAMGRRLFDVSAAADGREIQDALDRAAAVGPRAIVHIPAGNHEIGETLRVPPGDVQIVGDGYATVLRWTGGAGGSVLSLAGPARGTLEEFSIIGAGRADGLVATAIDQPGSRIMFDDIELRGGLASNLSVEGLDNTAVDLRDIGHSGSQRGPSVRIVGGPLAADGQPHAGRVAFFSGASSDNHLSYDLSGGADVLVRDMWYEGKVGEGFAYLHGRANVTMQGLRIATPVDRQTPAIRIANLQGDATLLTTHLDDRIVIGGDGHETRVLALGLFHEYRESPGFVEAATPGAQILVLNGRQRVKQQGMLSAGSMPAGQVGRVRAPLLAELLAQARTWIAPRSNAAPESATDLRVHRVAVRDGVNNVVLRAR
jgi:hypothetical protein